MEKAGERINPNKLLLTLGLALLLRAGLMWITRGGDLKMWMDAVDAWFLGRDPYSYAGSYPYFPVYIFFVALARLISGGAYLPYLILSKVPLVLADILAGWLIVGYVHSRTKNTRAALIAGVMYLFNPVIIYNGAFYGRFDVFCYVFVILALVAYENKNLSAFCLAAATAVKTFPVFLYPYFFHKDRSRLIPASLILAALLAALAAPFAIKYHNLKQMLYAIVLFNVQTRPPRGLSWQYFLHHMPFTPETIMMISTAISLSYILFVFVFPRKDFLSNTAVSFTMFSFFSKVIYEQYMTWAIPFLVMDFWINKKRHAIYMAAVATFTGIAYNEHFLLMKAIHVPQTLYNFCLAGCYLLYAYREYKWIKER
jgi:hypothetical protein